MLRPDLGTSLKSLASDFIGSISANQMLILETGLHNQLYYLVANNVCNGQVLTSILTDGRS